MVSQLLQNQRAVLHRPRTSALLGRHNLDSIDFRIANFHLELLRHHGVAFSMVVLHVEVIP